MAYTQFSVDVENISHLSDLPNATDGLSSTELKARFDKAGADIKDYINNTLLPELGESAAKGFTVTFPAGETEYELTTTSYDLSSNTIVFCQAADGYEAAWNNCGIECSGVTTNKLTFNAVSAPSADVSINVFVIN